MILTRRVSAILLITSLFTLSAGQALAAQVEVCLRVDSFQTSFGGSAPVTMWGFFQGVVPVGGGCVFAGPPPTALAIPTVTAHEGDNLLVHLTNNLPLAQPPDYVAPPGVVVAKGPYTEPVSIVIPGQLGSLVPTWTDGTTGNRTSPTQRVRSFTAEAPQQGTNDYTFSSLRAGTYLIQSGTHPAVQVQMGLYAILKVLPATGAPAREATLLFSEVDPVLHAAVASGQYGPAPAAPPVPPGDPPAPDAILPAGWLTSTIEYHPKYFLVNGKPFTAGSPAIAVGNNNPLIRFLNAGLQTKVPLLLGRYVSVVAEDGYPLLAPKQQYSVLLPAGKTVDAILLSASPTGLVPVFDRRLDLTNAGASPGGMMVFLDTAH